MNRAVDDIAADWAVRRDAGVLSAAEEAELDGWLAADPRNAGALLRAEAMLAYSLRACGAPAADTVDAANDVGEDDRGPRLSRRAWFGGAGASALAASFGFLLFGRSGATEIETAVGEVRRVPLADGSVAAVNTASRVSIAMSDTARTVAVADGEAFFEVARDPARPFVVEVGAVRVRAVGTAFSVRRRAGGADVLVTHGVVETWVEGREGTRMRLAAGTRSFVAENAVGPAAIAAPQDIERSLAWRSGELILDGETLGYAVAEFNRYNDVHIELGDPALAREPFVGYFKINDPKTFAEAAASLTGARIEEGSGRIRLIR